MDAASARAPIRVLMADDHPIVLAGMKALVAADAGLHLVGEASDGRVALQLARQLRPEVAVLDISMPGMNGVEVVTALQADASDCHVLILTVHEDRAYLRQLLDAGVAAYLLKRSAADELVRAIHAIAAGGVYLDPAIAGKLVAGGAGHVSRTLRGKAIELSERETGVLRLIAAGHSNKEIAAQLSISVKTVETYKARAMEKLGFRTRVDVVRYASSRGWLGDR